MCAKVWPISEKEIQKIEEVVTMVDRSESPEDSERYEKDKTELHIDEKIQLFYQRTGRRVPSLAEIRVGYDKHATSHMADIAKKT